MSNSLTTLGPLAVRHTTCWYNTKLYKLRNHDRGRRKLRGLLHRGLSRFSFRVRLYNPLRTFLLSTNPINPIKNHVCFCWYFIRRKSPVRDCQIQFLRKKPTFVFDERYLVQLGNFSIKRAIAVSWLHQCGDPIRQASMRGRGFGLHSSSVGIQLIEKYGDFCLWWKVPYGGRDVVEFKAQIFQVPSIWTRAYIWRVWLWKNA